ncbi:MAG: dihydropteroate synthase [Dokdonia sp.]|jgi:dihydropteroate synthase
MTINCLGKLIDVSTPKIMGVLNLTPDSFYDGGKYRDMAQILKQVALMLDQGASFIDIGAYSSRPDAEDVSETLELQRLIPVLKVVIKEFPDCLISVDTFRSKVAQEAIGEGAALINDISGGQLDPAMFDVIATAQVPYIMMHMRGTPQTMKNLTTYTHLTQDVARFFSAQITKAREHMINDLILDLGFGFAKTVDQNFQLLKEMAYFKQFELPILAGLSRKSMIYKTLDTTAQDALNGTSALHMIALQNGAAILRVHDVKEARECVVLHQKLQAS